jgi:hypothetical protein
MAEILHNSAEQLPGFNAMNGTSRAIKGAAAKAGDSGALEGNTGRGPAKGI